METVVFQHLTTTHFTALCNKVPNEKKSISCVTLYGRTADGKSVAAHVKDIEPYGFFKVTKKWWDTHRKCICEYTKWYIANDKMTSLKKFSEDSPHPECFYREKIIKDWLPAKLHLTVYEVEGYGIRNVHEGPPDKFIKITTSNSNTLRAMVKCLRNPNSAHVLISDFYEKLKNMAKPRPKKGFKETMEAWKKRWDTYLPMPELPTKHTWDPVKDPVEMFETHVKDTLVYHIDNDLPSCGWLRVKGERTEEKDLRSTCDIDFNVRFVNKEDNPPQLMAPYKILSYDIESQPHVVEGQTETLFPEPLRDPILCIGVCVFNMTDGLFQQYCFMWEPDGVPCVSYPALSESDQTDDYHSETTDVRSFRSEYDMLLAFSNFIQDEIDPDIISGYNILNFDNVYTIQRAQHLYENLVHGLSSDDKDEIHKAWCWGRQKKKQCFLKKSYKSSNQKGGRESWECRMAGREFMDLMKVVMDDHKLRSYKLDNVAEEFLGTRKISISYDDIPIMQKTPEGRVKLGVYCVKDAYLPCKMLLKMAKVLNAILMAQVTGVSLNTILNGGQQVRTVSLMLQKCKQRFDVGGHRWFLPDENKPPMTGGFEGAVVITPIQGFYSEPVATLDFASLYPSIMRAYNMCFSTIIASPKEALKRGFKWTSDMEKPTFRPVRKFDYPEGGAFEYVDNPDDICFITADKRQGILPEILAELLNSRKATKKLMKSHAEGSMEYAVCDGRQLALKVCANSVYGFTGATYGFLPDKRIASSVTRVGRAMANETKFMCEDRYKEYGVRVVYGDSVSGDTPLLLMKNNKIFIENIKCLQIDETPTFTWTERGWTKIKNKICHKLSEEKKMLKVHTHTGIVKCTSDHSLVGASGNAMFPKDVVVGETELMQSWPLDYRRVNECVLDTVMSVDFAKVLGMFMVNGWIVRGTGETWGINSSDISILYRYQRLLDHIFPRIGFIILEGRRMNGFPDTYDLTLSLFLRPDEVYSNFMEQWKTICYHGDDKIVPECILNSPTNIGSAFLSGLNEANGTSSEISQKGTIACLGVYTLLKSLGHDVVVDDCLDNPGIYSLRCSTLKKPNVIKKIVEIPYEKYVYDLTTENHHFQAGVGNIIVHNTDSVFVHLPKTLCDGANKQEIVERANQIGKEMAKMCTKAFLPPNDLEFEKIYYPLLLKGKKRYAGYKYEPGKAPNLDVKGFECVRRDYAPIVSRTQKEIFVLLCKENDIEGAVRHARQTVVKLLEGKVPLEDLILSKQLSKPPEQYKNPQPHVELTKYLRKILPPTQAPKTGDRIDYIIKPGIGKTCTRAAQPSDVTNGICSVDNRWYLNNQLKEPLTRVFDMVIDNAADIFKVDKIQAPPVCSGSMFSSWKGQQTKRTRGASVTNTVNVKRRKTGPKKKLDIKNFF